MAIFNSYVKLPEGIIVHICLSGCAFGRIFKSLQKPRSNTKLIAAFGQFWHEVDGMS